MIIPSWRPVAGAALSVTVTARRLTPLFGRFGAAVSAISAFGLVAGCHGRMHTYYGSPDRLTQRNNALTPPVTYLESPAFVAPPP